MDPDATLAALYEGATDDQRELLDALGDWIARGGFLPKLWERAATSDPNPEFRQ